MPWSWRHPATITSQHGPHVAVRYLDADKEFYPNTPRGVGGTTTWWLVFESGQADTNCVVDLTHGMLMNGARHQGDGMNASRRRVACRQGGGG
jgi:hypothetical protein